MTSSVPPRRSSPVTARFSGDEVPDESPPHPLRDPRERQESVPPDRAGEANQPHPGRLRCLVARQSTLGGVVHRPPGGTPMGVRRTRAGRHIGGIGDRITSPATESPFAGTRRSLLAVRSASTRTVPDANQFHPTRHRGRDGTWRKATWLMTSRGRGTWVVSGWCWRWLGVLLVPVGGSLPGSPIPQFVRRSARVGMGGVWASRVSLRPLPLEVLVRSEDRAPSMAPLDDRSPRKEVGIRPAVAAGMERRRRPLAGTHEDEETS